MSLRGRLTLSAAGAVALAVLIASVGVYFVVRAQLRSEVDGSLRQRVALIQRLPADFKLPSASALPKGVPRLPAVPPASLGGPSGYLQLVSTSGKATSDFTLVSQSMSLTAWTAASPFRVGLAFDQRAASTISSG